MIRCTLELIPGGVGEPELLGVIEIVNELSETFASSGKRGNYTYSLYKKIKGRVVYRGVIRKFPRLAYHPWNLIYEILYQINEGRRGAI